MGLNHLDSEIQLDFLDPEITWTSRALAPLTSLGPIKEPFFAANLIQQVRALLRLGDYDVLIIRDLKNLFISAVSRGVLRKGIFTLLLDATISGTGRYDSMLTPFLRNVDIISYNTKALSEIFRVRTGIDEAKLWYLPYGVDTSFFTPLNVAGARGIVSVGDTNRDYRTLLRSLKELGLRCKIFASRVLALPGGHGFRLEDVPASLAAVSHVPIESLRREYAMAEVIVIPLHEAGTGSGITSLLEAMSMGKAVVVAGTDGILDYVENGRTALVYRPGNHRDLMKQIDRLLQDENLRVKLGREARKHVERSFSTVEEGRRIEDLLKVRVAGAPDA